MLQARAYSDADYECLASWWEAWGWPALPKEALPEIGVVVESIDGESKRKICAGFVYKTDSTLCWIEWIISDKNYRESDRKEAMLLLIKSLTQAAKELGYKVAFTSVVSKHLIEKYKSMGFSVDSEGMTNLTKVL